MLSLLLATLESEQEKDRFTLFFKKQEQGLFRYALFLTKQPLLAEEVVQEAWTKCIQHKETFFSMPPDKRKPWMVAIVRNTAHTVLAREGRFQPLDPEWDPPAPEAGDAQSVVDVIRSMPQQYRTILELRFLLEWSHKEIAQYTGLSLGAVSVRLSRGRKLLQEKLIEEGFHP